jgi:hypothetical protein
MIGGSSLSRTGICTEPEATEVYSIVDKIWKYLLRIIKRLV